MKLASFRMMAQLNVYIAFSVFIALSNAGCGTYTSPSGNIYDLEPLTRSSYYNATEIGFYTYYYNYCQNTEYGTENCTNLAPVVQIDNWNVCISIGLLPQIISETSENHLQLVYINDVDLCGTPPTIARVTTFALSCSSVEYHLVKFEELVRCKYMFTVQTKYACAQVSKDNKFLSQFVIITGAVGGGLILPVLGVVLFHWYRNRIRYYKLQSLQLEPQQNNEYSQITGISNFQTEKNVVYGSLSCEDKTSGISSQVTVEPAYPEDTESDIQNIEQSANLMSTDSGYFHNMLPEKVLLAPGEDKNEYK